MNNFEETTGTTLSRVIACVGVIIVGFMATLVTALKQHGMIENLQKENEELRVEIDKQDSICNTLHNYILAITYQHEDDDQLMEEEQP